MWVPRVPGVPAALPTRHPVLCSLCPCLLVSVSSRACALGALASPSVPWGEAQWQWPSALTASGLGLWCRHQSGASHCGLINSSEWSLHTLGGRSLLPVVACGLAPTWSPSRWCCTGSWLLHCPALGPMPPVLGCWRLFSPEINICPDPFPVSVDLSRLGVQLGFPREASLPPPEKLAWASTARDPSGCCLPWAYWGQPHVNQTPRRQHINQNRNLLTEE